jgi:hypothetical protein
MGFNATVVICLDHLESIRTSQNFGAVLTQCILDKSFGAKYPIYLPNGVVVVEVHHASGLVPVLVGGNTGKVIPVFVPINPDETAEETNIKVLKEMASALGYQIRKAPKRKVV